MVSIKHFIYTTLFTNSGSMQYKQTNIHIQTNKQDTHKISNMSNENEQSIG